MAKTHSPPVPFVHLHVHSAFSLLEGALTIERLAELCVRHRMPALALSDTGNLFGALEFSEMLSHAGVQPIIGCALKVSFATIAEKCGGRFNGHRAALSGQIPSLVLLAKDKTGYANLVKLSSRAFLHTEDTAQPHISANCLETRAQGLICLTGGPSGPVNRALVDGNEALAGRLVEQLKALFPGRLYVELQRHDRETENAAEPGLIGLAHEQSLPLVATNEAYFAARDDFEAHDALLCIAQATAIVAEDRRRLTPEHFFKSPQQMAELFADIPEAVRNTVEIARRCSFRPKPRAAILPRYATGDGDMDEAEELRRQSRDGLKQRLSKPGPATGRKAQDYHARLDYELGIIEKMGFPGYFLIVADFIKKARESGIPVGPGRGSGAGSLVAYALTITDLDPLQFNLLFERFLNPDRVSMPDFDIDFCQERRDEVIDYVQHKYGRDRVAQIITFGKLASRAVCRDVGRVLQMPYGQVDRLCKLIPNNPANPVTLAEAVASEPRLQEARDSSEDVRMMLNIGLKLEGLYRHASTHAAGVVIAERPLDELVPLYRDPRSDMPVTQFNMKWVEKAGLVKFDFLGLKTLSVLDRAVGLIRHKVADFQLDAIAYTDPKTYEMLSTGDTVGVFQLESSGFKDLLRKARPSCIEDIIALIALYRPGPMENIPKYLAAKHGEEAPEFLHDIVTPITADTYGVIIYQEQVVQIAQALSGYSFAEADLLRRAMGKKIKSEMDRQKIRFVDGAIERGVDRARAEFIFDLVAKFAGYGFNKAHSACYAVIAYRTAYLKANYPVEFLAASMTLDAGNTEKLHAFKREAERLGITVTPPSIDTSQGEFVVEDGRIHYSLAALKNVGRQAVDHIVDEREKNGPYRSLDDFARRAEPQALTKRMLETLILSGAFDIFERNRARLFAGVDAIMDVAERSAQDARSGQTDMFAATGKSEDIPLPETEPWLPMEQLSREQDAVGFYLSGHPLDDYMKPLERIGVESWAVFADKVRTRGLSAGRLVGMVTYRRERRSKNGNRFAFAGFSDPTGQFETIVFSDQLNGLRDMLEPGNAVLLRVDAEADGDDIRLRLVSCDPLEKVAGNITSGIVVLIGDETPLEALSHRLANGGRGLVRLVVQTAECGDVVLSLGDTFTLTPQIKSAIKAIPGVLDVHDL